MREIQGLLHTALQLRLDKSFKVVIDLLDLKEKK
jgi:hypothetical protein